MAVTPISSVDDWLGALGLDRYCALFAENGIDMDTIPVLTEDDLKELGIPFGHRKRMLHALSLPPAVPPPPERRQLTVLFCDLVGSTDISARLDPEDLREVMHAYFDFCQREIERYDGVVAKYLGDGVIAYFGYPRAHEDAAERAVRAGCRLSSGIAALRPHPGVTLQVRIGIATGLVVVGDILGQGAAREEAVIGETPSLSARLQALAAPGTVLIADATRRLLGRWFLLDDIGIHELRGISAPTRVWRVRGERTIASRFDGSRVASRNRLAGRESELGLLVDCWARAAAGEGRTVLICGPPGIGKSRLVMALCDHVRHEPHTFIRLQCSPLHASTALHPIIAALERTVELSHGQDGADRAMRLRATLASYGASEDLAIFARLLSVPIDAPADPGLSAAAVKRQTLAASREWLIRRAREKPTVVIIEDLHWADPTTLELIESLLGAISGERVLILLTHRPGFQPAWAERDGVVTVPLSSLAPDHAAAMVRAMAAGRVPETVARQIVHRADGVPLFVEELTRAALDWSHHAQGEDGAPGSAGITFPVPETLQDSLLARLDRLGSGREVAQVAAAIGREFRADLLSRVIDLPNDTLRAALRELMQADMVQRSDVPSQDTYVFRHALIQEIAYATLLHRRRRDLHARIGRALEDGFPEIASRQPEVVARHYTEAALPEGAIAWWKRAAERSLLQAASLEAIQQFERALALVAHQPGSAERDRQEAALRSALTEPLFVAYGPGSPERERNLAALFQLHERRGDTRSMFALLYAQSVTTFGRGEMARSVATISAYLRLAEQTDDPAVLALGHMHLGHTELHQGRIRAAIADLDRALDFCRAEYLDRFIADFALNPRYFALACRALGVQQLGQTEAAAALATSAVECALRGGHVGTSLPVLFLAAMERLIAADAGGVAELAARLDHMAARHEAIYWRAHAELLAGWAAAREGQIEMGLSRMRRGRLERERMQGHSWAPQYLAREAELLGTEGRFEEALQRLGEAEAMIEATDQRISETDVWRQRARIMLLRGDSRGDIEGLLQRALAIARGRDQVLAATQVEADLRAAGFVVPAEAV